jgi:hypothetical protein
MLLEMISLSRVVATIMMTAEGPKCHCIRIFYGYRSSGQFGDNGGCINFDDITCVSLTFPKFCQLFRNSRHVALAKIGHLYLPSVNLTTKFQICIHASYMEVAAYNSSLYPLVWLCRLHWCCLKHLSASVVINLHNGTVGRSSLWNELLG